MSSFAALPLSTLARSLPCLIVAFSVRYASFPCRLTSNLAPARPDAGSDTLSTILRPFVLMIPALGVCRPPGSCARWASRLPDASSATMRAV
jgi:hypothetical protein